MLTFLSDLEKRERGWAWGGSHLGEGGGGGGGGYVSVRTDENISVMDTFVFLQRADLSV